MSTINIMDQDACKKAIKSIGRFAGKLQQRIHVVAVSTLAHIRDHGDTTLATSLLDALPKGQRREALAYWFQHFSSGKAVMKQDKTSGRWLCELAKLKDRAPEDFNVEGAFLVSYADLTKESKPGKTFTVDALLKMLKAKADEDGTFEDGSPKVDAAARDLASQLLASIEPVRPALKIAA